ncbi:MAG: hypothetical protein LBQ46_09070 [Treponema sp.]|jgi:hypothetical protein|nr:hypothetical protein [Treponema sp.]
MRKRSFSFFCAIFVSSVVYLFPQNSADGLAQSSLRSIDEIFPALDAEVRAKAFSSEGYFASYRNNPQTLEASGIDPRFRSGIGRLKPSVVAESLAVIPYPSGPMAPVDIYNGLRHISALGGRLYHSETRKADIPLFEESTRLENSRRTSVKEDPPPLSSLPGSETIYIRVKDANFSYSYYQVEVKKEERGFTYSLSNNRDLSYIFFPVIKAGCFVAQFYFEPVKEGVLIYNISGAEVSDFVASKIDIPSAIQKRLEVILGWAIDGVSGRL